MLISRGMFDGRGADSDLGSTAHLANLLPAPVVPCLCCDSTRLNPTAPHRVYLMHFPHLDDAGVSKIGTTHCANDDRLRDHTRNGGLLPHTVQIPDRATALHIERPILNHYQPMAPVALRRDLLPQGGATECWSAQIGYPDVLAIDPNIAPDITPNAPAQKDAGNDRSSLPDRTCAG